MKPFALFGSSILILVTLVTAAAFISKKEEIPEKHLEIVLRNVGHRLLLTAGDSTSRVLPVKKINDHLYQISFQNDFSFVSDTLINLVQREFQQNAPGTDYIVNLRNCKQNETVLAFEINNKKGNIIACRGRKLERSCYVIEIELLKPGPFNFFWLLLLILPLSVVGYYVAKGLRQKEEQEHARETTAGITDYIPLASFRFYVDNNVLKREDKIIPLSEKETKALKIFAENINQIVEREKLMKEIWEDKGLVVISRNVDVLVSKLRKVLADDNSIKFITVPGRGYKFVIEQHSIA